MTERVQECLAYQLCQYKGISCGPCLKMSVKDWKAYTRAVLQVVRV